MRNNPPPYPKQIERQTRAKTRPFAIHTTNPAGSKLLRRAMKQATGKKHPTYDEARKWYSQLRNKSKIERIVEAMTFNSPPHTIVKQE